MRVAAYYRYSSDQWMQKEHSEARQKDKCRTFINHKLWHLVEEFSDREVSGDDNKPDLGKLKARVLTDLQIDALVIDDMSRLTRKGQLDVHEDLNWLRDCGIKLVVVRDGGHPLDLEDSDTVFRIQFDVWKNNKYLKDLGASVVDGMRTLFKQKKLGWMGPAPLGFEVVKRLKEEGPSYLEPNADLEHVTKIFQAVLAGKTIRSCVDILEKTDRYRRKVENGETGPKDPSAQSVKHLLRNSIYCGIRCLGVRNVGKHAVVSGRKDRYVYNVNPLEYASEIWELDIPKAVSVEDFLRVQKLLDANKKKHNRRPATVGHRYSSLLTCGNCGGHLVANTYADKKSSKKLISYVCAASQQRGCKCREEVSTDDGTKVPYRKQVRESELDQFIKQVFAQFVSQSEVHQFFVESLVKELEERKKQGAVAGGKELDKLALKQARLKTLVDLFMESDSGGDELQQKISEIQQEITTEKKAIDEKSTGRYSMLEYAEEQHRLGEKGPGPKRYLGVCYKLAKDVVEGKLDWNDERQRERATTEAIDGFFVNDGNQKCYAQITMPTVENAELEPNEVEIDPKRMEVFVGPGEPDEILENFRTLGLTSLEVQWAVGNFRGKPKHNISGLNLVLFDGDMTHIGKDSQLR